VANAALGPGAAGVGRGWDRAWLGPGVAGTGRGWGRAWLGSGVAGAGRGWGRGRPGRARPGRARPGRARPRICRSGTPATARQRVPWCGGSCCARVSGSRLLVDRLRACGVRVLPPRRAALVASPLLACGLADPPENGVQLCAVSVKPVGAPGAGGLSARWLARCRRLPVGIRSSVSRALASRALASWALASPRHCGGPGVGAVAGIAVARRFGAVAGIAVARRFGAVAGIAVARRFGAVAGIAVARGVAAVAGVRIVCLVGQGSQGSLSCSVVNADTAPQPPTRHPAYPELSGTAATVLAYVDVYGPLVGRKRPR